MAYDRSQPLACDTHFLTPTLQKCHWDTAQHCLVADQAVRVQFYVNLLWSGPQNGYWLGNLIMKNQLGTPQGLPGGEYAGADLSVYQPAAYNISSPAGQCIVDLQPGDKLWAVPCCIAGQSATLTNAKAGNGNVTVNYVEVLEIE